MKHIFPLLLKLYFYQREHNYYKTIKKYTIYL